MAEADTIAAVPSPNTAATMAANLVRLGLEPGMTVLVHSSLSALGWVCGGPVAVIHALESVLTPAGTLVMPAHSGDLSDPAGWAHPPVPGSWWPTIRDTMPPFDPALTPCRGMGALAEAFRHQRGVVRSRHPQLSFTAWGRHKTLVTAGHPWHYPLGPGSPLDKVRQLGGRVLLLGVGHGNNTSLHLAETLDRGPGRRETAEQVPWGRRAGKTAWRTMANVEFQTEDFEALGAAFEKAVPGAVRRGRVGLAEAQLVRQDDLVAFAVDWMGRNRR